jgi:hypothetical protein
VDVNELWLQTCGFTREEVVGQTMSIIQGPLTEGREVRHLCECIGSPCLRQCVHGAPIAPSTAPPAPASAQSNGQSNGRRRRCRSGTTAGWVTWWRCCTTARGACRSSPPVSCVPTEIRPCRTYSYPEISRFQVDVGWDSPYRRRLRAAPLLPGPKPPAKGALGAARRGGVGGADSARGGRRCARQQARSPTWRTTPGRSTAR